MLAHPDGLDAFLPGRHLLAHEDVQAQEAAPAPAPYHTAGREAVIAYSRARYARSREEVERQIGEMMGWGPPSFAGEDPAIVEGKRKAFEAMTSTGMPREQAVDLLSRFDLGDIERQIAWLPSRGAKNPARFLAAAIEGSYQRPLTLRRLVPAAGDDVQGRETGEATEAAAGRQGR